MLACVFFLGRFFICIAHSHCSDTKSHASSDSSSAHSYTSSHLIPSNASAYSHLITPALAQPFPPSKAAHSHPSALNLDPLWQSTPTNQNDSSPPHPQSSRRASPLALKTTMPYPNATHPTIYLNQPPLLTSDSAPYPFVLPDRSQPVMGIVAPTVMGTAVMTVLITGSALRWWHARAAKRCIICRRGDVEGGYARGGANSADLERVAREMIAMRDAERNSGREGEGIFVVGEDEEEVGEMTPLRIRAEILQSGAQEVNGCGGCQGDEVERSESRVGQNEEVDEKFGGENHYVVEEAEDEKGEGVGDRVAYEKRSFKWAALDPIPEECEYSDNEDCMF
ncbi:hypothetical protein K470DRAFT_168933 [Piedraia hortae CBS 480.64]|uniref:Uncharacterized protein n=1 Tax=Piedraia hortae CBS 480.64 TaxID=1314780 RepID=A0A6A7BQQ3_9PEZI|nr:hypothetical protein K470DRAFT_168933 [Piedraia hortae CBS 480.64]